MTTEQIITLVACGVNVLNIVFYFGMYWKINKNGAKSTFQAILDKIPTFINMCNAVMPASTKLQKTNYVLSLVKSECEELNVKYKEKKAKAEVEAQV